MRRASVAALLAGIAAGCAMPALKPAPEADLLARDVAIAMEGNVQLVARAGAWHGMPGTLASAVTPILVTVANDTAAPIRIDYHRMELVSGSGARFHALAPQTLTSSVRVPVDLVGMRTVFQEVRLPTLDMLRKALPEGVLAPGGRAAGFVYFEPLRGELARLELRAAFPSADGENATRLEIPFVLG